MEFSKYQQQTRKTFIKTKHQPELVLARMTLGLTGESGEVAEKVKKFLRGDKEVNELRFDLAHELGDVLWYISEICNLMGLELDGIAEINLDKLQKRHDKGTIQGEGDDR